MIADDGYAAARALHARRLAQGWIPIARKMGFTNRTIWPRYGVYGMTAANSTADAELLPLTQITLKKKEAIIDRGLGANVLGSPLLALAHLVDFR